LRTGFVVALRARCKRDGAPEIAESCAGLRGNPTLQQGAKPKAPIPIFYLFEGMGKNSQNGPHLGSLEYIFAQLLLAGLSGLGVAR
jgi:hypothetical protein